MFLGPGSRVRTDSRCVEDVAEEGEEDDLPCGDLEGREIGQVVFERPLRLQKQPAMVTIIEVSTSGSFAAWKIPYQKSRYTPVQACIPTKVSARFGKFSYPTAHTLHTKERVRGYVPRNTCGMYGRYMPYGAPRYASVQASYPTEILGTLQYRLPNLTEISVHFGKR